MKLTEYLESIGACLEAREWSDGKSLAEAWATCPRPDWLLWLLAHIDRRTCVWLCADIAERVLCYAGDNRVVCERAITAARAWADNPSESNRDAAKAAAWAAGATAQDAQDAACATAQDAAGATAQDAQDAAWAAAATAQDAQDAAWAAGATAQDAAGAAGATAQDAAGAAGDAEIDWQLSHIREAVPTLTIAGVE